MSTASANDYAQDFCRDSTLPICNVCRVTLRLSKFLPITEFGNANCRSQLFSESPTQSGKGSQLNGAGEFGGCALTGISLKNEKNLANLGMVFSCGPGRTIAHLY